ncbi:MAG TPA: hypothetical protein PKW33_15500 [Anaerolineaceae bacterium]|nr:hypothetical protein [Anaerolineaceae bacterium]HPN53000.1 hypothetical protein [Anaerolineaceae bacterium]
MNDSLDGYDDEIMSEVIDKNIQSFSDIDWAIYFIPMTIGLGFGAFIEFIKIIFPKMEIDL